MSEIPPYTGQVSKYTDSKEKLIETMRGTAGNNTRHFDIAKAILDVKGQEEVANQTKSLMKATWVLASATIALVGATTLLVFATFRS